MPNMFSPVLADYNDSRYPFIRALEEPGGQVHLPVYVDSVGIATIGAGFNVNAWASQIVEQMPFALTWTVNQKRDAATAIKNATAGRFANDEAALSAINTALRNATGNQTLNFAYTDPAQVKATFDSISDKFENLVNDWYGAANGMIPSNRERLVLLSLAYNNLIKPGKLGKLREAIISGDRAEAWYQIRYESNGGESRSVGIQKRRIFESEVFGLYANSKNINEDEARNVFAMLQRHRDQIIDEELTWAGLLDGNGRTALQAANKDYDAVRRFVADGVIDEVHGNVKPAVDKLVGLLNAKFSLGIDPNVVQPFSIYSNSASALSSSLDASRDDGNPALANNVLLGSGKDEQLVGGSGDDTLWGGAGKDILVGGSGADAYLYASGDGQDTIRDDKDGKGSIRIGGGTTLGANGRLKMAQDAELTWEDGDTRFEFKSGNTADIGTLTITGSALGAGAITIENFDLNVAKGDGYLGLKLESKGGIAAGARDAQTDKKVGWLDDLTTSIKGALKTFTIYAPRVSDETQYAQVDIMGNFTGGINKGDGYIPYSGSPITLEIPAGEDSVTVALVNTGDPGKSVSVQVTATFSDGETTTGESNTLTVSFEGDGSTEEPPPQEDQTPTEPDRVIKGDLKPMDVDGQYLYDDLDNVVVTGEAAPDQNDYLHDSAGNDSIDAGGGNNSIYATRGGNDTLIAGSGDDGITAGDGNNVIKAGAGNNQVYAGSGNNQISVESGDSTINVGNGRNKITGNAGDYRITAGDGNNTIEYQKSDVYLTLGDGDNSVKGGGGGKTGSTKRQQFYIKAGQGDNTIEGGNDVGIVLLGDGNNQFYGNKKTDLATAIQSAGQGQASGKYGNLIAAGNGNNTIVGGNGNDVILTGSGANLIFMGPGNDTFMGGYKVSSVSRGWTTSLDGTIVTLHEIDKVAANTYAPKPEWSGDQYSKDAQSGVPAGTSSDTIFGGAGNDSLLGGAGVNLITGTTTIVRMRWRTHAGTVNPCKAANDESICPRRAAI